MSSRIKGFGGRLVASRIMRGLVSEMLFRFGPFHFRLGWLAFRWGQSGNGSEDNC